jgi:hypothetical protein
MRQRKEGIKEGRKKERKKKRSINRDYGLVTSCREIW